jgi:preprotein translocase subunit SecA
MLKGLLNRVVGDSNEREIQKLQPLVDAINGLEPEMEQRTDAALRELTDRFREQIAAGDSLDDLLVDGFAAVRETAKRTVDMRPFDVQLIGGIVLHQGKVAEMRTGEGKTLVATMPVYLNALRGRGVHLVTVNDYLARRDALWMGPIYRLLGLSVGLLQSGAEQPAYLYDPGYDREPYPGLRPVPRQDAYAADVTYGTNNEFGFDYLRDNLALVLEGRVQRPLYYAIVDEVDNIFIDEARTPLIISGPSDEPVEEYSQFAAIARKLEPEIHYEVGEKERSVFLTDAGLAVVEQETGIENIYDEANYRYVHYMQQALKAQVLFLEGRDYIRQRKNIILIDQHTGRLMPNRRLSEGLHQAIEAKEGVPVRPRDVTSATITIQNYFRMYEKLAGMSGTALTESEEFFKIYNLDVLAIPTNKPVARRDHGDVVYRSEEAKLRAVAREILASHSRGQPVLVGTTSVEMSERLSNRLTGDRIQMAAMAPRAAYALQDADLNREERAALRETMNASLETQNPSAWRRMMKDLDLNPNALAPENLAWMTDYLNLPNGAETRRSLEHALREGIAHEVLNAKEHTREAAIIARAGEPGAVTIATNMAGRGVDIKLGGELSDEVIHKAYQALRARGLDPFSAMPAQMDSAVAEVVPQYAQRRARVLEAEGLHILGTERHEARRIDNQLRGRAGRQGEPGSSRFYLSLEDDLMRRFGRKEMLSKLMEQIGDDFPIEHSLVSKTIERAQTSVEGYNFDIRKHLLEYDDVLNRQRETIYDERLRILQSDDLRPEVWRMLEGQVDEYLGRHGEEAAERRLLFAGLDDIVPLTLPAPTAPFQGPLAFGSHLTAFPPFTIGFIADQLADNSIDVVRQTLHSLPIRAAAGYGQQIRGTVGETAKAILEKYEEQLAYYQTLLDEKIDDYLQLMEERGELTDLRRLVQHLERTYPFRLSVPRSDRQPDADAGLDELREHWLAEVEAEFHRQVCAGLLDRVQARLPVDVRLDRPRPARIPASRLGDELRRVLGQATKLPIDEPAHASLKALALPDDPDASQVWDFVERVKEWSQLDYGRLDRLVGHVLGAYLDDLMGQYLAAVDERQDRVKRDLERLQVSVLEGKGGGRGAHLIGVLGQLNDLVHLEIADLEVMLSQAVAHEYDKWAQRQIAEIEADADRAPLSDSGWTAIAEHLLATHYTERQVYDRGHRRRIAWAPRLPLSYLGEAEVEDLDAAALREAIFASLGWALEQRENAWGRQEFKRWESLSIDLLDEQTIDSMARYLGEQQLGDLLDRQVEDLPPDVYDLLRLVVALRHWREQDLRLGELPRAEQVLAHLGRALEEQVRDIPIGALDGDLQKQIRDGLREAGLLDDPAARTRLAERPISKWDRQIRDDVAGFLGRTFIAEHGRQSFTELEPQAGAVGAAYLQRQRRFVDEARVQHFLVYERLHDLPSETQSAALLQLSRARLDRLSQRKISNLDVKIRQVVTESLQRMGLFSDKGRRDALLAGSGLLGDLDPAHQAGFGAIIARQKLGNGSLRDLDGEAGPYVLEQLKLAQVLADPVRLQRLPGQRLGDLDGPGGLGQDATMSTQIRDELLSKLKMDLAGKTMEELPAESRDLVHRALDEQNYFVDQEKVGWYERKTLAQLPSDLQRGLELWLGQCRLTELAEIPFRELPTEVQKGLEAFFDSANLLTDRAARLRLTQTGSLADLLDESRSEVFRYLGRQWLVQIRDQRPPALPERDRDLVWSYLRSQGYFSDDFKEELFAYQRLDEFDDKARRHVERAMEDQLDAVLDTHAIGDLPPDLQSDVRVRLGRVGYFVDEPRLRQLEILPVQELPDDLQQAVESALGSYLMAGLTSTPLSELPPEIMASLLQYYDESGYFVDEKLRAKVLDRRLADLSSDQYEEVVADLAAAYRAEIGESPVAELDDDLRQGLREALEDLGYFESTEVKEQALSQTLGSLRREDQEALSAEFGQILLDTWADQRHIDLPQAEQERLLSYLQARDWFLDQARVERLDSVSLADLEKGDGMSWPDPHGAASKVHGLVEALRLRQANRFRRRRLVDLNRDQTRAIVRILQEEEVTPEPGQMRSLARRRVRELDRVLYRDLLLYTGGDLLDDWGTTEFQDLEGDQQALIIAYLGRQIMGRIERRVLLHTISRLWIGYLTDIEDLRRGIGLEAYGQRDPLVEYKRRAFELFEELGDNIRRTAVRSLFQQPPQMLRAQ